MKLTPEQLLEEQLNKFPNPFEQLVVDHTDMCPTNTESKTNDPNSSSKYKYALVIIDRATRQAEVYPCKTTNSSEYLNHLLNDWIPRYGYPKSILSDNGKAFISKKVLATYRLYNIRGIYSTPYSPQSHGLVESFNKTLKGILRCLTVDGHVDENNDKIEWTKLVGPALLYYRSRMNSNTKYSPSMLTFGRELNLPVDTIISDDNKYSCATTYVAETIDRLRIAHKAVLETMKDKQEKNIKHNKQLIDSKNIVYNIGDQVYIREILSKDKLVAKWIGPYTVLDMNMNNNTYKVKAIYGKNNKPITVNHRRIKRVSHRGELYDRSIIAELNAKLIMEFGM